MTKALNLKISAITLCYIMMCVYTLVWSLMKFQAFRSHFLTIEWELEANLTFTSKSIMSNTGLGYGPQADRPPTQYGMNLPPSGVPPPPGALPPPGVPPPGYENPYSYPHQGGYPPPPISYDPSAPRHHTRESTLENAVWPLAVLSCCCNCVLGIIPLCLACKLS